jgi:hypothetical protein
MNLPDALTPTRLWEAAGALLLALWGMYKQELQDGFKVCCKRLYAHFFQRHIARRVTEAELKSILGSGLVGLETLLLLLLKEYAADRVTVMEYSEKDGSHWATCVVEVRQAEMQSVQGAWQLRELPPGLWEEVCRINSLPGRKRYVQDARIEDVAPLRAALLASGVWSAYYQSMPTPTGQPSAMLSLSWHTEHLLTDAQLTALHLSGSACATVLLLMAAWKPTSTD